uniref:Uncharacterized protein n=1 Tax=Clandestinovirus TaxID=2831644 RepID=A0A8F8KPB4_9VIRU|nr:hypothetical protein KOM_12_317 [Clandestinovirus]
MFANNRFAVVDATVSEQNAYTLFPGYDMYTFAIFDNNLTKDKFLITLATPLYIVTFGANGAVSESHYDGKISDLLLKAGYEDPNVLLKCRRNNIQKNKSKPPTSCETRFATIATPSDLVDYNQSKLGLLQSFAITEHLDSWPSIVMRLMTSSTFSCVLFSSNIGRRITWDSARSSLKVQTKDDQLFFDKFTSFCSYVNTVQGTIDKVSIETASYEILIHTVPPVILDVDSIKNSAGIYTYYKFDRHIPLWDQVQQTFFSQQPDDKLLGIAKYKDIHIPIYAIPSSRAINVPKAWCSSESTYECLEVKYKEYEGDKIVNLDRLSGDGGCAAYRKNDIGAGTLLLELAKDLARYVLQATKLELDDLSTVECKDDKYTSVSLPLVSYLKKQKTWYETKDIKPTENHKYERVKRVLETKMEHLKTSIHLLQLDMNENADKNLSEFDFILAALDSSVSALALQANLVKFVFNMIFFLDMNMSDSFMSIVDMQWAKDTDNFGASDFWYDNEEEEEPTPGTIRSDALALTKYIVEPVNLHRILASILIPNAANITSFDQLMVGLQSVNFDHIQTIDSLAQRYGPITASLILFIYTCLMEMYYSNEPNEYYEFKNTFTRVGQLSKAFRDEHVDMLSRIEQYPNDEDTMRQFLASLYDEGCKSIFIPMKKFLVDNFGYAHILFFDRFITSAWDITSDEKRNDLKRKNSDEVSEEQPTKYGKFDLTPFMMDD